jgi:hypothetical protein
MGCVTFPLQRIVQDESACSWALARHLHAHLNSSSLAALPPHGIVSHLVCTCSSRRRWHEVCNASYVFDRRERTNDIVLGLTQSDVLAFYREHISPASPHRKQLVVKIVPSKEGVLNPPPEIVDDDGDEEGEGSAGDAGASARFGIAPETAGAIAGGVAGAWAWGQRGAVLGVLAGATLGRIVAGKHAPPEGSKLDQVRSATESEVGAARVRLARTPVVITDMTVFQRALPLMPLPAPATHALAPVAPRND